MSFNTILGAAWCLIAVWSEVHLPAGTINRPCRGPSVPRLQWGTERQWCGAPRPRGWWKRGGGLTRVTGSSSLAACADLGHHSRVSWSEHRRKGGTALHSFCITPTLLATRVIGPRFFPHSTAGCNQGKHANPSSPVQVPQL
ncbi:hypothetical protein VTI74DRAFT_6230 [Chaetomium olivicolor]